MSRFRMRLSYDGTRYMGWQVQPHGDTIQERLEKALTTLAKTRIQVVGSGRTDAGVHALGQIAHFDLEPPIPLDGLRMGANSLLPRDIRVMEVEPTEPSFHARYDAVSKIYRYHLDRGSVPNPLRSRFALHHPFAMDRNALDRAADTFVGEHDFSGFSATSGSAKTTIRRVLSSRFIDSDSELIYEVRATGFLQYMVRTIVGTLLDIGRGKKSPDDVAAVLARPDRSQAGATAPPHGLALYEVHYH